MNTTPDRRPSATDGARERRFREEALRAYEELFPRASGALEALLSSQSVAFGLPSRTPPPAVPRGLAIRNIGRSAGQCARDGTIVINAQLVDFPDDLRDTVAHELAHAVVETARRWLSAKRGRMRDRETLRRLACRHGEWAAHGAVWKSVARQLGDSGDRCHALPLRPLRRQRRFLYRADCGAEKVLSAVRHNRLQRDRRLWYRWRTDGVRIFGRHFVGEVEP